MTRKQHTEGKTGRFESDPFHFQRKIKTTHPICTRAKSRPPAAFEVPATSASGIELHSSARAAVVHEEAAVRAAPEEPISERVEI